MTALFDDLLTSEQIQFRDSVRGFAERHLAAGALVRAHEPSFPFEVAKLMAKQGLLGITFPEADGGAEGSLMDAILAIEAVSSVCPRSADVVQTGNFGPIRTFAEYATPDQKARYLGPMLAGEALISVGMSEPEAGSAVTDLATSATPDGDGFRVNGTKVFSSHSPDAKLFLVYVRYGPGVDGIGSVLIERGTAGFSVGKPVRYVGGDEWCQLYFDNVLVPAGNVLLREGGFKKQIAAFNVERLGNSARSLAFGRHAFTIARKHAEIRTQFGRTLSDFQGIQWKFAEMAARMEAAQLMLYRVAGRAVDRLPDAYETALVKYLCNEAGFFAANESMQVLGALGYSEESLVEYCWRRARGWQIAGGSLEMMKNRIAEGVFERRFSQRAPKRSA
ncbi:acyl-CoA dehydrogenase-like protein [alpha proteobacterium BAL199]|jgi:alkylation response protein AidB-like acyl-CoA dehydrogenase|nr:acyl-CoA dehydrogenase-like protein [alpha proteobacterium BAL199]